MFKLGETVRDTISGFRGVITSRCENLYGGTQVLVVANEPHCIAAPVPVWLDEERCALVEAEAEVGETKASSVEQFMADRTLKMANSTVPTAKLFNAYTVWCGDAILMPRAFNRELERLRYMLVRTGDGVMAVHGVHLDDASDVAAVEAAAG